MMLADRIAGGKRGASPVSMNSSTTGIRNNINATFMARKRMMDAQATLL
jgi:hypothetical protein